MQVSDPVVFFMAGMGTTGLIMISRRLFQLGTRKAHALEAEAVMDASTVCPWDVVRDAGVPVAWQCTSCGRSFPWDYNKFDVMCGMDH